MDSRSVLLTHISQPSLETLLFILLFLLSSLSFQIEIDSDEDKTNLVD
jgi:hypothetical protein